MTMQDAYTPRKRLSRPARYAILYLCLATAIVISGLQHFVLTLPSASGKRLQYTDGIVVMTGGQQRLADGLHLLTEGIAGKMLISGVGDGVSRAVLVQQLGLDERQVNTLFCCVDLDFAAKDTRGNAIAARRWALENNMRSLRLVTANFICPAHCWYLPMKCRNSICTSILLRRATCALKAGGTIRPCCGC